MTATFEQVDEADDVAVGVGVRVLERVANARLRGEVAHTVEPFRYEQSL